MAEREQYGGLADIYDQVMSHVPYREWADWCVAAARHWEAADGPVLDLACGTASVGRELADRGYQVFGVDGSVPMLRAGQRRLRAEGHRVPLACYDFRQLALAPVFGLVVCLFDSLNYVLELDQLRAVLAGVRECLRPGGLFLFDVNTVKALADELFTMDDLDDDAPVKLRWVSQYNPATRTTRVDMRYYLPDGTTLHEIHRERAYTPAELSAALAATGWETLAELDAYSFARPHRQSDRVCYVCRPAPR